MRLPVRLCTPSRREASIRQASAASPSQQDAGYRDSRRNANRSAEFRQCQLIAEIIGHD